MRNLVSWTPRTLSNDLTFDRFFDDFFRSPTSTRGWLPATDVIEHGDHYELHLDLPGFKRDDIEVTVEEGTLTIRGMRRTEESSDERNVVRSERYVGEFARSFRLGNALDLGKIEAHFEDGVLMVRVPKAESAKPRQIDVK